MKQFAHQFVKIPALEDLKGSSTQSGKVPTIIGIVDASGSMSNVWAWLADFWNQCIPKETLITITFSNTPSIVQDGILKKPIQAHGGGGTEIVPAFKKMEEVLANVPLNENITIIFISDGQDNTMKTIQTRLQSQLTGNKEGRPINFICLGIGKGFPTDLAMKLRELYHVGDPQIPAVYLIEYASEQAFFNKFETMKPYFQSLKTLHLSDFVNLFPYDETISKEVFEGQWVMYRKQKELCLLQDNQPPLPLTLIKEADVSIFDLVDIFRAWVQDLQIKIIQKQLDKRDEAEICAEAMKRMIDQQSAKIQVEILSVTSDDLAVATKPFNIRAKEGFIYKFCNKLKIFYEEVTALAKGLDVKTMSEFDKAKHLMIGTITGKHAQKGLALKDVTLEEFAKIKQEFLQSLKTLQLKQELQKQQINAPQTHGAIRGLLSDVNMVSESFQYLNSQYDLTETFPLLGQPLVVRRTENSISNPWLVLVNRVIPTEQPIDVGFLVKQIYNVEVKIGEGQKEEANCVVPLFSADDEDLKPFLRSRLFKLMMTFMIQQNPDSINEESYLALLSQTLICLILEPQSERRDAQIEIVYQTLKLAFQGEPWFEEFLAKYLAEPQKVIFEEFKGQLYPVAKILVYTFYAVKSGLIQEADIDSYFWRLELFEIYNNFAKNPALKQNCLQTKVLQGQNLQLDEKQKINEKTVPELVAEELEKLIDEFIHVNDMNSSFEKLFKQATGNVAVQLSKAQGNNKILEVIVNEKVLQSTKQTEALYKVVTGRDIDASKHVHVVYEATTFKLDQLRGRQSVDFGNIDEISARFRELHVPEKGEIQLRCIENYKKNFIRNHLLVEPLTEEELQSELKRLNMEQNLGKINFQKQSGLASNACCAKACKFYLKPLGPLEMRRHISNWQRQFPLGFHDFLALKVREGKNKEETMAALFEKYQYLGFPEKQHGSKEQVERYYEVFVKKFGPKQPVQQQQQQQQLQAQE